MQRDRGALLYPRHFFVLSVTVALLFSTDVLYTGAAPIILSGYYAALHASIVVSTLRQPRPLWRKLSFIMLASSVSMASVMLGSLAHSPALLVTVVSGLGAAAYALLIRWFWIHDLPLRALIWLCLGCVAGTLATLFSGLLVHKVSSFSLAVAWWCSFSAVLWYQDALCQHNR